MKLKNKVIVFLLAAVVVICGIRSMTMMTYTESQDSSKAYTNAEDLIREIKDQRELEKDGADYKIREHTITKLRVLYAELGKIPQSSDNIRLRQLRYQTDQLQSMVPYPPRDVMSYSLANHRYTWSVAGQKSLLIYFKDKGEAECDSPDPNIRSEIKWDVIGNNLFMKGDQWKARLWPYPAERRFEGQLIKEPDAVHSLLGEWPYKTSYDYVQVDLRAVVEN